VPLNSLGANGDYYLNNDNGDVYLRASSLYSIVANIHGAAGATGNPGPVGPTGPQGIIPEAPTDGGYYARRNSSWQSPPGGGNVSVAGTPVAGQIAQWTSSNTITGVALANYAPLASPVFTGDPQAPTPLTSDNDTSIATTAFVQAVVTAIPVFGTSTKGEAPPSGGGTANFLRADGAWAPPVVSGWSTGDVKLTFKTVADVGWVLMTDGSIGDASSGGTTRANADCQALFTLFYGNCSDTDVPLQTSTGTATTRAAQGTAATAWGAHCRIVLPKMFGRALAGAGSGAGLTGRTLGASAGAETHTQTTAELVSHSHGISDPGHAHGVVDPGHVHYFAGGQYTAVWGGVTGYDITNPTLTSVYSTTDTNYVTTGYTSLAIGGSGTGIGISAIGNGAAMSVMNPTTYLNVMVCL
jgi:hypothetical protein